MDLNKFNPQDLTATDLELQKLTNEEITLIANEFKDKELNVRYLLFTYRHKNDPKTGTGTWRSINNLISLGFNLSVVGHYKPNAIKPIDAPVIDMGFAVAGPIELPDPTEKKIIEETEAEQTITETPKEAPIVEKKEKRKYKKNK